MCFGIITATKLIVLWLFILSYMMVDNFQRGIFKWPLVFGWSAVPPEDIKKFNLTISDPIR